MSIILRLDRVMADRKISLNELSEKVGVSNVNFQNNVVCYNITIVIKFRNMIDFFNYICYDVFKGGSSLS